MGVYEWMIIKAVVLCIAVFIYGFWLGRKDRDRRDK
jgi:FtsZ-interacting cell division protein ZipA